MSQQNRDYEAKNARIKAALVAQQPYWLLKDTSLHDNVDWYYALIQVGDDRIPMPVILNMFGKDFDQWVNEPDQNLENVFGYPPEYEFDRNFEVEPSSSLLKNIIDTMIASTEDDPDKLGSYDVTKEGTKAWICTRFSRDPRNSSNGGDYYEYRDYEVCTAGILARDSTSSDFGLRDPNTVLYRIDITDLRPIFEEAQKVINSLNKGIRTVVCKHCGHPFTHEHDS